uniref:E3 ubiquitin-protein ligase n=1 Tax=Anopheles quadriannulatus TaxID=34691 RepID=A0A182XJW4_ANOQN
MENWRCKQCGNFPNGEVYQCAAKDHFYCAACKESKNRTLCTCGAKLKDGKVPNPIEKLLHQAMCPCRYAPNGCTWKFVQSEMDAHLVECRFRPYRCVAASLNVIKCNWQGLQHEIEDHLAKGHKELGEVFRFRESTSLVFKEQISLGGLKLVDAFSKRFLFYFFSDVAHKKLSFLMLYFGRREEAAQYCYELEISGRPFAPPANGTDKEATAIPPVVEDDAPDASVFSRTVKFVERCNSDSENLAELLDEERCVSLSHRQVKNYLHEGKLHMRYRVRKVDGGGREKTLSVTVVPAGEDPPLGSAAPVKPKPRPPPFVFAKKGTLAGPGKRSSSSSNTSSSSSSSSTSKSGSSTGSGKTVQSTATVASRSPSSASTVTISSQRNSGDSGQLAAAGAMDSRHSLSSINRLTTPLTPFEKPEQCPLMTPSINKHDVPPSWSVSQTTTSSFAYHTSTEYHRQVYGHEPYRISRHYPPSECTTTAAVCQKYTQPYKVKDDRPYLLKQPTNCLFKPQPKWCGGASAGVGHGKGGWSA